MSQHLQLFLARHSSLVGGISVWLVLSLVINLLLLLRGPQAWADTVKKRPRAALVFNILFRAFGVDLVGVILHVRDYVNAKAQDKPPSAPSEKPATEEYKKS